MNMSRICHYLVSLTFCTSFCGLRTWQAANRPLFVGGSERNLVMRSHTLHLCDNGLWPVKRAYVSGDVTLVLCCGVFQILSELESGRGMNRLIHDLGKNCVQCALCNVKFTQRSSCRRHLRVVHFQLKACSCPHCGKQFTRKDNALSHQVHCTRKLAYT